MLFIVLLSACGLVSLCGKESVSGLSITQVLLRLLCELGAVGFEFLDGFEDVVHGATVGQQQRLGQADGRLADLLVAFQFLEALPIRLHNQRCDDTPMLWTVNARILGATPLFRFGANNRCGRP